MLGRMTDIPTFQRLPESLPQMNTTPPTTLRPPVMPASNTANPNVGVVDMQMNAASLSKGMVVTNADFVNGAPTSSNLQLMQQLGIQYQPTGAVQQFAAQQPMQPSSPRFLVKETPSPAGSSTPIVNTTATTPPTSAGEPDTMTALQNTFTMLFVQFIQEMMQDEANTAMMPLLNMMLQFFDANTLMPESEETMDASPSEGTTFQV
jgi:hypothetical protein